MNVLVKNLIDWPARTSRHLEWLGPLVVRIVVGEVFANTGWGKLTHLPKIIDLFVELGIPAPAIMAPFVSAVEFGGGVLLLFGLLTRWAAPPLVIVMAVAIFSAKLDQVDSLDTLLGFEEMSYMAMFIWLSVAGPGKVSLDYLIQRWNGSPPDVLGK
jgi:putative oxidoreductase